VVPADLLGDREVIARAEAIRPALAAASDEIERERRLPPSVLDKLHEAELFRLLLPRSANGIETDPVTFFHVIETIARADASTAWCLSQAGGCAMSAAYLDLPVAHAIFGSDPRAVLAWGPGPKVRAIECEGGYRVTGVWAFASGGRITPPGSARTARSSSPMARQGWRPTAGNRNAPCWCAARMSRGPTSGTPWVCAARPATNSL
jgi:alkylation response protein AidB-like acyl-CoA dehydrogenase